MQPKAARPNVSQQLPLLPLPPSPPLPQSKGYNTSLRNSKSSATCTSLRCPNERLIDTQKCRAQAWQPIDPTQAWLWPCFLGASLCRQCVCSDGKLCIASTLLPLLILTLTTEMTMCRQCRSPPPLPNHSDQAPSHTYAQVPGSRTMSTPTSPWMRLKRARQHDR